MANSRHAQRVQQPLNYNSREALQTSGAFSKSKGERTGFPSFYVTSSSPLFFFFFVPFRGGGSQLLLLLPELVGPCLWSHLLPAASGAPCPAGNPPSCAGVQPRGEPAGGGDDSCADGRAPTGHPLCKTFPYLSWLKKCKW
ncbi:uncharacterized protein [Petaurus breviceps papuanus]|uniref:uncharacterized protein isoform X4 n=1 Tax=Petaurus breviceps papuanus TaxID=3040969 RepID=UPI0036DD4EDB